MQPKFLVNRIPLVLCILLLFTFFGVQAHPAAATSPTYVRIVDATPDAGVISIFVDGIKVVDNV